MRKKERMNGPPAIILSLGHTRAEDFFLYEGDSGLESLHSDWSNYGRAEQFVSKSAFDSRPDISEVSR